jgi:ATP-dependent DNA helicase DinG
MISPPATIQDILGPGGRLAERLPGFEFRSSQVEMALMIETALDRHLPAIIEAGTGTGKTFGYLVPLVLSGKKAVISTGTKNLQDQIYFKDIPLLQEAAGLEIDAMVMKGRKNYLCVHKYHQFSAQSTLPYSGHGRGIGKRISTWLKETEFGDRAELSWLPDEDPLWDSLSSSSDQCLGGRCPSLKDCFLNPLRSKAARTQILIVNHHLFFSDLKVKKGGFGEIIPRYQVAVFDEAHKVEEIATSYLGESLSTRQITDFADELEKGLGPHRRNGEEMKKQLALLRMAAEGLRAFFQGRQEKDRLDGETLSEIAEGPAKEMGRGLRAIQDRCGPLADESMALSAGMARAADLENLLGEIFYPRGSNWLNWYEKRRKSLTIHASPLDISGEMQKLLLHKVKTAVFTSATLSTYGTFDFVRSRLGLPPETLSAGFPSHFDFKTHTLMYVPKDLPSPGENHFAKQAAHRIGEILERSQGRALVLFTSHSNMNEVYHTLEGSLPYSLLKQGDAPRSVLLERFREDLHSVLLATGSFWQGVDVPGESLSCLIIDKLPFDSPGEPLVAARIEAVRERGGNPFMEYQVPAAIITLKQGLGRLIRKSTDRGVFTLLDKRVLHSRYGRSFRESLPELPLCHTLEEVGTFFNKEVSPWGTG